MDYINEALKFIESKEMREYQRTWSKPPDRNDCAEIVSLAPASLERKIPVLNLIAEQTKFDPENVYHEPTILAKHARLVLDGLYNPPAGTVFILEKHYCEDETIEKELFTTFEAVINRIGEFTAEETEYKTLLWFYVEKWILGEHGKMNCFVDLYLNNLGEIWYFNYAQEFKPKEYSDSCGFFDYTGELNLPTPFTSGDIITADCRPFAEEKRVLILKNTDEMNRLDCCGVVCLHISPSGDIGASAFKHNFFLQYPERTYFSVLYRAEVYSGELTELERPLATLSTAIKANPLLSDDLYDYISERDDSGIKWEQLKEAFSL